MPQIFQVLKCFKCLVFQVHQNKKSNKFACKMCGEKQTIKRHYGLGNGQECRIHVQKLNGIRGEVDALNEISSSNTETDEETEPTQVVNPNINKQEVKSKWSNFVDNEKDENEPNLEEPMFIDNTAVVLEVPAKRKKFVKPKAATNTPSKNIPWDKTPVIHNDIIPFTDNFFSGSKDLEIIEVNIENQTNKLDTSLSDKIFTKENIKPFKVNKNQSKWSQFEECEENENQMQNATIKNIDNNISVKSVQERISKENNAFNDSNASKTLEPISIFSMYDEIDETDLDSILDI